MLDPNLAVGNRKIARIVGAAIGLLFLTGFSKPVNESATVVEIHAFRSMASLLAPGSTSECFTCIAGVEGGCTDEEHQDEGSGNPFLKGPEEAHGGCAASPDRNQYCGMHSWCSETFDAIEVAERIVVSPELPDLSREVADGLVAINTTRSAVQVRGCDGAIVAHVPVSDAALLSLTAH